LIALREKHRGLKLEINHCMTAVNYEECEKVFDFCEQHHLNFNPIYVIAGQLYHNEGMDLELGTEAREHLVRVIDRLRQADTSLQLREIIDQLQGRERDFDCWAGRTQFFIEENCDVFPNGGCPSNYKIGNLRDFDFNFPRMLADAHAKEVLSTAKQCRQCRLSCETMTTLTYPEALAGLRHSTEPLPEADDIHREEFVEVGEPIEG